MRLFDTITRHDEGPRWALPIRISLLHTLAPDETPHLIELHLGHRDILERLAIVCTAPGFPLSRE